MKLKNWCRLFACASFLIAAVAVRAQTPNCWLAITPPNDTAALEIEASPGWWNYNYSGAVNPAFNLATITSDTAGIPAGTYLNWCIDVSDGIPGDPNNYTAELYSSCDTNIDTDLPNNYPASVYVSPTAWHEINYLLNHKNGAYFYDVQVAIWSFIGGPVTDPGLLAGPTGPYGYPPVNMTEVNALIADTTSNAPNWQESCGDVIAVIVAVNATPLDQLTIIEVPYPCVPCISVSKEVACFQPTNNCADFGKVASGFAGVGCNGIDQPAFCYQISVTNCGTVPLTNIVVSDSLLGLLTSNFFTNSSEVLQPGAGVTSVVTMSFPSTATNTVTVAGETYLTNQAATNLNGVIVTNGTTVSAFDSAVAQVDTASISCSLTLNSPNKLSGSTDNNLILPVANYYSVSNTVTMSIHVCNTGMSALTNVTISIPALASFNCTPPGPFNLAQGQCLDFPLCVATITCPNSINFNVNVSAQAAPDANHCAVFDLNNSPITVCSGCTGGVSCSTNTGCLAGTANVSGTVLMHCSVYDTNISGDTGIAGVPVNLFGTGNVLLATTNTDANGNYTFVGLGAGVYNIIANAPANYLQTYPVGTTNGEITVTILVCSDVTNVDFGFADTTPPTLMVKPGGPLGCNPTNMPTDSSISSSITATVACGSLSTNISHIDSTNGCSVSRVFTIILTSSFGGSATNHATYTWTADTIPLILTGVPAGTNLGCNPASLPTLASVLAKVSANDTCSQPVIHGAAICITNGCGVTQVFTIVATNACGNMATALVTNTWSYAPTTLITNISFVTNTILVTNVSFTTNVNILTNKSSVTNIVITTNCCTNSICSAFNFFNPGNGWLWLNANCSANPGKDCYVYCSNASVTLACTDGKSYSFPVPNSCIHFSSSCTVATNWFDGSNWNTTLPCKGDSQVFLQGCAIPWQSDFTFCQSACWTASFSCSQPGFNCSWQWGAACYSGNQPSCGSIAPKACYQNSCPNGNYYSSSDYAGCPENYKPYCTAGGTGYGGNNCTGSFSGASTTCAFGTKTNKTVTSVITYATNTSILTNVTTIPFTSILTNSTVTTTVVGPVLSGVPTGMNLGCNPTNIPTVAQVLASISASETCSAANVQVSANITSNGCLVTQVFTISAANACGGSSTAYVTNIWTADLIPPTLTGVPANTFLGCGSTNGLPGDANVMSEIQATDQCSQPVVTVTHVDTTNGCTGTRTFTITATDACGNTTTTNVLFTWIGHTPDYCTNSLCSGFNSQNPGSGWLWLNAHCSGSPGKNVTLYCQNATVTLNCLDGKSYTYPVPDGQVNFSSNCTSATNWFDGTQWNTTLPCSGDDQIFLQGCAIPWRSEFAGCKSVCWTGVFTCDTAGQSFNWQWGASCFADNVPDYTNICPKACHTTSCANGSYYRSSDFAGCPENHKPYCIGGGTGLGGTNCTGSWSGTDTTCTFNAGTQLAPVLNGVPASDNLGVNPTNIPTVATILGEVSANDVCGQDPVTVTVSQNTNGCGVTQIFTISATNDCGASCSAYVTNTWMTMSLTNHCTNTICSSFNASSPGTGWLWLNSQLSGKPGNQEVYIVCSNATVTLTCNSGKTYTYPVPCGTIHFSPSCTVATNWFDGTNWNTVLPCGGDDQIFASGCAIPWLPDFAGCRNVCWTADYSCNVPGLTFNWQFGASCYNNSSVPSYSSICPKATHQTTCPNGYYFNQSHNAGTPENYNPYCVGGGTGYGGNNCTGNLSNPGTCRF